MEYVLSVCITAAQLFFYVILWDSFFIRRIAGNRFWVMCLVWVVLMFIGVNVFPYGMQIFNVFRILLEIVIFYGMNMTLFHGRWSRRLFVIVTGYAAFYSLGSMVEIILLASTKMNRVEYVMNRPIYISSILIRLACLALVVFLVHRFHHSNPDLKQPHIWGPLSAIFPLCTLFVIYMAQTATDSQSVWLFCLMIMSAVDFATLFLFDHLESSAQMHEVLAVARQRADVQEASIRALRDSYAAQRKMTHEFRGYLFTLSELLTHGKTKDALQYLNELKVQQTERILLVNSHNPLIDAILNQKGYAAEERKIDIRFIVNDLSSVTIDPIDLTIVLGNLLDNAMEACEKLEEQERWISVKVIHETDAQLPTLFLSIENSSRPVEIHNDHIVSTKSEPELHGFGLPNVLSILEKVGAMHVMKYKEGSFLFCAEWPNAPYNK